MRTVDTLGEPIPPLDVERGAVTETDEEAARSAGASRQRESGMNTANRTLMNLKGISHCAGASSTSDLTIRLTIGLQKIDGQWTVVREHHSAAQPS